MILVTGATGTVGRDVAASLIRRGAAAGSVRAGSRGGEAVAGAVGVRLDFEDPATWAAALVGVESVFLVRPPSMSRVAPLRAFVDAAVEAGARRIVFLSLLGAERNPLLPHRRVEQHLEQRAGTAGGGLEVAFLRAGFFMQNLTGPHRRDIVELDEIVVPAGSGETSFVDTRDIAEVAARLLADGAEGWRRPVTVRGPSTPPEADAGERAGGEVASAVVAYDLTGPRALSYHEVAGILTEVLDRGIEYRSPSLLRFGRVMRGRGHPWLYILVMAGIYTTTRLGMAARVTDDLPRLLGRPPTSFRQFVDDHRAVWRR
jgi:uncharacterized protein YbjT (DUF2867 family)